MALAAIGVGTLTSPDLPVSTWELSLPEGCFCENPSKELSPLRVTSAVDALYTLAQKAMTQSLNQGLEYAFSIPSTARQMRLGISSSFMAGVVIYKTRSDGLQ